MNWNKQCVKLSLSTIGILLTDDKQWSLSAKPESNLRLLIQIVAITCQLFF